MTYAFKPYHLVVRRLGMQGLPRLGVSAMRLAVRFSCCILPQLYGVGDTLAKISMFAAVSRHNEAGANLESSA